MKINESDSFDFSHNRYICRARSYIAVNTLFVASIA